MLKLFVCSYNLLKQVEFYDVNPEEQEAFEDTLFITGYSTKPIRTRITQYTSLHKNRVKIGTARGINHDPVRARTVNTMINGLL